MSQLSDTMQGATVVKIAGLGKRFGEFDAVVGLDLEVFKGEIFALLGPNGAGKTTTIRMLIGILQPTAGTALIDGLDCFGQRPEVMRRVGYVPEEPIFYDYLRGREIIKFVGEMHGLPQTVITSASHALIEKLDLGDALEEYAANYSRGMKKKLALVCALMHDPLLLLLDEPTDGLDPYATRAVHELMRERVGRGLCVFFSTHLLDQAEKLCDRVGVLFKGRLAGVGRLDELRENLAGGSSLEQIFFSLTKEDAPISSERIEDSKK